MAVTGAVGLGQRLTLSERAWRFYGTPLAQQQRTNCGAIGEVRYVLGWLAAQVGRVDWDVTVNGVALEGEQLRSRLAQVANQDTTVQLATNLIVAGELHYAAFDRDTLRKTTEAVMLPVRMALEDAGPALPVAKDSVWLPISTVYPQRNSVLHRASLKVRGVWPHPANPVVPDPPLFGVLDVLEEIEQLQDLAWAQNNSRVAQLGFLEISKEYSFIGADNGSDFFARLNQAIEARMADPRGTGAVPITLTTPGELVGKGIKHTPIEFDPDNQLENKMRYAIQRLAYGFPAPPEVLLGMTSTNRATAYQIEESTYESHCAPIAKLVGRIYAAALAKLLEGDDPVVEVDPDPTALLARQSSVPDLQWAYRNGLVGRAVVVSAMGIDPDAEEDKATPEDIARILLLSRTTPLTEGGTDGADAPVPDDAAEQPAIVAAGNAEIDLESVTAALADVDEQLFISLTAASGRDVESAMRRLGSQCRNNLRQEGPDAYTTRDLKGNITNIQLPPALGLDRVKALGVDPRAILTDSLMPLGDWWQHTALPQAAGNVAAELDLLGVKLPAANGTYAKSADRLVNGLVDWLTDEIIDRDQTLDEVPPPLMREVIAVAGGRG